MKKTLAQVAYESSFKWKPKRPYLDAILRNMSEAEIQHWDRFARGVEKEVINRLSNRKKADCNMRSAPNEETGSVVNKTQ